MGMFCFHKHKPLLFQKQIYLLFRYLNRIALNNCGPDHFHRQYKCVFFACFVSLWLIFSFTYAYITGKYSAYTMYANTICGLSKRNHSWVTFCNSSRGLTLCYEQLYTFLYFILLYTSLYFGKPFPQKTFKYIVWSSNNNTLIYLVYSLQNKRSDNSSSLWL